MSILDTAERVLARLRTDADLNAWVAVDEERVRFEALRLDDEGPRGRALFGVPVGIKDLFDTADLPTRLGSPIHADRQPTSDAAAVAALRQAGALVIGKTATTEFATVGPTDVGNPRFPGRTPGGSSSGSASAVAAGHVPIALGTQTAGSIGRPASYCEVVGFKPTFGTWDRAGTFCISPVLDTIGVLAATVGDAARAFGFSMTTTTRTPVRFARTSDWERIAPASRTAIEQLVEDLGLEEISWPDDHAALIEAHVVAQHHDTAQALRGEPRSGLSAELAEYVKAAPDAAAHADACARIKALTPVIDAALSEAGAVLTPSTDGPPPIEPHTGDPHFCRAWTAAGVPTVSVPLTRTADGLPVGLQVVAARGCDDVALRAAADLVGEPP